MVVPDIPQAIHDAEEARADRDFTRAISIASDNAPLTPENLQQTSGNELRQLRQLWRIWTVASMQQSGRRLFGERAAHDLEDARRVIVSTHTQDIQELSASPDLTVEEIRDEANYNKRAAALTGDASFLHDQSIVLQQAITLAQEQLHRTQQLPDSPEKEDSLRRQQSALSLSQMELFSLQRTRGLPQGISFESYTQAYREVVALSPQVGGWDRKAAASWMFIREARIAGNRELAREGRRNFHESMVERDRAQGRRVLPGISGEVWYRTGKALDRAREISRKATLRQDPQTLKLR